MATKKVCKNAVTNAVPPVAVYHSTVVKPTGHEAVKLRIAAANDGNSGLLEALARAFINKKIKDDGAVPFSIAWYLAESAASFNYLAEGLVDLTFSSHLLAGDIAMKQNIACRREYCFRSHWMFVGPKENHANIPLGDNHSVYDQLTQLFISAVNTSRSNEWLRVRFLTRFDSSATNIMECFLWSKLGQAPWSDIHAQWYHRLPSTSLGALEGAAQLKEYTITDRETWLSADRSVRDAMAIFKTGTDKPEDPLLKPVHAMLGSKCSNKGIGNEFLDWLVGADGQNIIRTFSLSGSPVYCVAPEDLKRLGRRLG